MQYNAQGYYAPRDPPGQTRTLGWYENLIEIRFKCLQDKSTESRRPFPESRSENAQLQATKNLFTIPKREAFVSCMVRVVSEGPAGLGFGTLSNFWISKCHAERTANGSDQSFYRIVQRLQFWFLELEPFDRKYQPMSALQPWHLPR